MISMERIAGILFSGFAVKIAAGIAAIYAACIVGSFILDTMNTVAASFRL